MKARNVILPLVAVAGVGAFYFVYQAKKALKIDYYFDKFKVISIGANSIDMRMNINIKNVSNVEFLLKKLTADVLLNDVPISVVMEQDKIILPYAVTTIPLDLSVKIAELGSVNFSIFTNKLINAISDKSKKFMYISARLTGAIKLLGLNVLRVNDKSFSFDLALSDID